MSCEMGVIIGRQHLWCSKWSLFSRCRREYAMVSSPSKKDILRLADSPCLFVLHFNHNETLGRHGGARFGTVPEFVQAIDIRGGELPAAHVEQRAHHLAHHITKERSPAHGESHFFVVRTAQQLA